MNRKELFILSVTIFLTVLAWVASDILHARAQEHAKLNMSSVPSTKEYHLDENIFTILKARVE